jgi:hypothetical protein
MINSGAVFNNPDAQIRRGRKPFPPLPGGEGRVKGGRQNQLFGPVKMLEKRSPSTKSSPPRRGLHVSRGLLCADQMAKPAARFQRDRRNSRAPTRCLFSARRETILPLLVRLRCASTQPAGLAAPKRSVGGEERAGVRADVKTKTAFTPNLRRRTMILSILSPFPPS